MSRYRETREVRLTSLILPGRWSDGLDLGNVRGLVVELEQGRGFGPIRVERTKKGLEVVQGFHRIKAAMDAGCKTIRAEVWKYDDELEREADQLAENLRRRKLPPAEEKAGIARLFQLARMRGFDDVDGDAVPPTIGGAAARNRFRKLRINCTVRRRFEAARRTPTGRPSRRSRTSSAGPRTRSSGRSTRPGGVCAGTPHRHPRHTCPGFDGDTPPTPPLPVPWRSFGLETPEDIRAGAVAASAALAEVVEDLKTARRKLAKLIGPEPELVARGYRRGSVANLHGKVSDVLHLAEGIRPAGLCPWCKGIGIACMSCASSGVALASLDDEGVPPRLLIEGGQAMVQEGGKDPVPLSKWLAAHPPGGKRNGAPAPEARR